MGISDGYETVLVTGGTGFVAGHSIVQLLNLGYKVRTTVREIGRQEDLKLALRSLKLVDPSLVSENIAVFKADLLADDGWAEALYGCHYVLHLASPLPFEQPEDEEDQIIKLATEGTRRVLRFSRDAGVKKVVYTSSFAAIGYGHPDSKRLTESDWGVPDLAPNVYIKSKILAEMAAWDFINDPLENPGGKLKFTSLNPCGIFGPKLPLPAPIAATGKILKKFIDGSMSFGGPKISYGIVDVRDVAKIHIQAMKLADTDGKRFILTSSDSEFTILETATILTEILPKEMSAKLPTRELPTLVLKVLGYFLSQIRHMLPTIRPKKLYNANRAKVVFEWTPTDPKTSLYDACMTIGT